MYTNTAKSHTEYGQHNGPDTVTLSASETKDIYILINNPKSPPRSLSNWRPASRLPLGQQQQQSAIPKSMGISQRSVIVHCPGKSEFSHKAQGSAGLHR